MKEKFLIESKKGIFHNFIRRIKRFFYKNSFYEENKKDITILESRKTENSLEELKVNIEFDNKYQKDEFMKKLSDNPELLENFSIERLEIIKQYFKDMIEIKKEKLAK